jgi:putative ABC transport system substrate-binding protein
MIGRIGGRAFVWVMAVLVALLGPFCLSGASEAQQSALPRHIGIILVGVPSQGKEAQALRQGLRDAGYVEGRDVVIEWRHANGDYARVPEFAAELVRRKVDVIVVESTSAALAVKSATSAIPIVMAIVSDPVGSGLVTSLANPGGNVTGLAMLHTELAAKRLQLLQQTIPRLSRVAVLWNPATPSHPKAIEQLKAAAPSLSIDLTFVSARTPDEFGPAFLVASREHAQALYLVDDPMFFTYRATLLKLATNAKLPVISSVKELGGLLSYGADFSDAFRRSAGYVDRILKGAKPGDLPIEQPTQFELVVNLRTAKAIGLTIPPSILLRADEVIR